MKILANCNKFNCEEKFDLYQEKCRNITIKCYKKLYQQTRAKLSSHGFDTYCYDSDSQDTDYHSCLNISQTNLFLHLDSMNTESQTYTTSGSNHMID